jgi:hypothetical protein
LGGKDGTQTITAAIIAALARQSVPA